MKHVVLDSNAVILDVRPGSEPWRRVERAVEAGRAQLHVPAVVVDEVLAHKQNRFQSDVAQAIEMVARLRDEARPGWSILPYPSVEHREVVARALARRRPFDKRGHDGYRDTLIWETVLALARRLGEGHILFLSRNHKDFGDGKGLHADLRAEVAGLGVRVDLLGGLASFVDA